jgi:WD40 repeat protein
VARARELRQFQTPGKVSDTSVECADLSPDGKTLATSVPRAGDGMLFWDTVTGERRPGVAMSRIGNSIASTLRFAPDGKSVATICGDWVRFWDVVTARETRRLKLPNATKSFVDAMDEIGARVAFLPDSTVVAASSRRDGSIALGQRRFDCLDLERARAHRP